MICPRCRVSLDRTTTTHGMFFHCPKCDGRAVGMALLRRVGAKECVRRLWQQARQHDGATGAACPECRRMMVEVAVARIQGPLRLDVCTGCEFVWFDPREFEQFPPLGKPRPLPEKARELIALEEARRVADEAEKAAYNKPGPDELWQWIPAMLGLPVEENAPALSRWPWLTWGLAAVLVAIYALTAGNLDSVIKEFGLVPAQLWLHGGITFATSFFLHGGLLHLVGNVYFLLVFGDNVEDDLGRWRFVAMLAISALVGDLLHVLGNAHSELPCVGASGGISGVVTYYALRFPRVRLGLLFRYWVYFRWIHLPAYAFLLLWFGMQFLLVVEQQAGVSEVAALAHLGGAAVGVAAWLLCRGGALQGE